jgi:hypothetical protein
MSSEAAGTSVERLLARHPDMPSELELVLRRLATACARLERANADLAQSVARVSDDDLRTVRQRGIERRLAEYGGLELLPDGRPMGRHPPSGPSVSALSRTGKSVRVDRAHEVEVR